MNKALSSRNCYFDPGYSGCAAGHSPIIYTCVYDFTKHLRQCKEGQKEVNIPEMLYGSALERYQDLLENPSHGFDLDLFEGWLHALYVKWGFSEWQNAVICIHAYPFYNPDAECSLIGFTEDYQVCTI